VPEEWDEQTTMNTEMGEIRERLSSVGAVLAGATSAVDATMRARSASVRPARRPAGSCATHSYSQRHSQPMRRMSSLRVLADSVAV
jgi:hypothetical protein